MNKLTDCNRCLGIGFFIMVAAMYIAAVWLFGGVKTYETAMGGLSVIFTLGAKGAMDLITGGLDAKKAQAAADIETAKLAAIKSEPAVVPPKPVG